MQDLNIKLASVIALKNEIIWNWKNRKGKNTGRRNDLCQLCGWYKKTLNKQGFK